MRQNKSETTARLGTLPRCDDDSPLSPQQLSVLLRQVIIVLLAGAIVALVALRMTALDQTMRLAGPALMVLLAVTGWHFLVRERIQAAVHILAYGAWAGVTGVVIFTGGTDSAAVIAYPLIILMSGWLIGSHSALVVANLTVAATIGLVLAESLGSLPKPLPSSSIIRSGDQVIIYILSGVLMVYFVRVYKSRLDELKKVSSDLARRTLDLELRTSELHRAQAVGKIGSWVFDPGSKTMHLSAETRRIFGLREDTAESHDTHLGRIHPEDRDAVDRAWQALIQGGAYDNEYRIVDGQSIRWIRQQAELELGPDGTPLRVVGISQDVTERKRAEAEIRQINSELEQRVEHRTRELQLANHELESFAYSVSHDLRAPLRAIEGFSRLIETEYVAHLDERGKDYFRRVRGGAARMAALIDDILKLSRISRQKMERVTVDLSALVREAAEDLQGAEPERNVDWEIAPQVTAQGDSGLLRVAVQNLIGNAWKYSSKRETARIEFGISECNGRSTYFVRDNGAGFDMAYADKLFGAFQRLHSPGEFPGTGIGLATVKRIIHRHGGEVRAEGKVGEGASFYFTL